MIDYDSGTAVTLGSPADTGPLAPPKSLAGATQIHELQKKSVTSLVSDSNNAEPSTPNSFQHARNDSMDNETSPSSFNELDESPQAQDTEDTDFPNGGQANTSFNLGKLHLHEIDPLHIPEDVDPQMSHENGPPNHYHINKFKHSLSLAHHRRHTAPPEQIQLPAAKLEAEAMLKQNSVGDQSMASVKLDVATAETTQKRSTFPTPQKSVKSRSSLDLFNRPLRSFDSTNSEIQRMRSTFVTKRNIKKRRKDFLEDDKVLIGNKISEGHENFVMAYNMLTGIRVAVSRCSGVMKKLSDDDFHSYKKLTFNMDGSELTPSSKYDFKFKDYCPEVFRELRTVFGLDPADYLISITGKYILSELGSPGKSGSFFYFSRDYRYIIKTIHHSEHKQLRRILKHYYEHVKANPNTLISQIYGLHRVKMPFTNGVKRKVHFLVMNNLFPPHRDIHLKYDLKGSTWGRFTNTDKDTDYSKLTLKDLNWLERKDKIKFGPDKRNIFFKQLDADVRFLESINVMDYSLLMGIHDVKKGNNEEQPNKLAVFEPKSQNKNVLINTNPISINREDLPTDVFRGRSKFIFYGHDGGIRSTNEHNEPSGEIYYMGVIDFLTNYSLRKRLETFWRSLNHSRSTISAVPAKEYGERFLKFIKRGTTNAKSKTA